VKYESHQQTKISLETRNMQKVKSLPLEEKDDSRASKFRNNIYTYKIIPRPIILPPLGA